MTRRKKTKEEKDLDILRKIYEVDACEKCFGARGGVLGNENIVEVDGKRIRLCDACTFDEHEL